MYFQDKILALDIISTHMLPLPSPPSPIVPAVSGDHDLEY